MKKTIPYDSWKTLEGKNLKIEFVEEETSDSFIIYLYGREEATRDLYLLCEDWYPKPLEQGGLDA